MLQEQQNSTPKPPRSGLAILTLVIIALVSSQIYSLFQIQQLKNALTEAAADIEVLANGLDYTTALAKNADSFAHSHPFSDIRLKINVTPLSNALERVLSLQSVQYNWRKDVLPYANFGDELQIGLIAQDVQKIFPGLVVAMPNGYLAVDYEMLTPILVEAIKEQQIQINDLQALLSDITINR
jgi:hypothetical protein